MRTDSIWLSGCELFSLKFEISVYFSNFLILNCQFKKVLFSPFLYTIWWYLSLNDTRFLSRQSTPGGFFLPLPSLTSLILSFQSQLVLSCSSLAEPDSAEVLNPHDSRWVFFPLGFTSISLVVFLLIQVPWTSWALGQQPRLRR
jgi:hypothetical protein